MLYKEVIDLYKHPVTDMTGFESSSKTWSDQYILTYLLLTRASLIMEYKRVGFAVPQENYLNLCLSLEDADPIDCPCAPPSNCVWKKTVHKLPRGILDPIVTNLSGSDPYVFTNFDKLRSVRESRVPAVKNTKIYTIKNGYLLIPEDINLKVISIQNVFEDNYEALKVSCNITKDILCNPLNTDFSTDFLLVDNILKKVWGILPQLRGVAPIDQVNNENSIQ